MKSLCLSDAMSARAGGNLASSRFRIDSQRSQSRFQAQVQIIAVLDISPNTLNGLLPLECCSKTPKFSLYFYLFTNLQNPQRIYNVSHIMIDLYFTRKYL